MATDSKSYTDPKTGILTLKYKILIPPVRWHLDSAERRAASSPDTFQIPPAWRRENLVPGDSAKLLFLDSAGRGERMWVRITQASKPGPDRATLYVGTLLNEPVLGALPRKGTAIEFGPEHVADIAEAEDEN